jgi:hypothetical protein
VQNANMERLPSGGPLVAFFAVSQNTRPPDPLNCALSTIAASACRSATVDRTLDAWISAHASSFTKWPWTGNWANSLTRYSARPAPSSLTGRRPPS